MSVCSNEREVIPKRGTFDMSPSDRCPPDLRLLVARVGDLRDCLCTSDWHCCPSDAAGATAEFLQMCVSVSTSHRANRPDSVFVERGLSSSAVSRVIAPSVSGFGSLDGGSLAGNDCSIVSSSPASRRARSASCLSSLRGIGGFRIARTPHSVMPRTAASDNGAFVIGVEKVVWGEGRFPLRCCEPAGL